MLSQRGMPAGLRLGKLQFNWLYDAAITPSHQYRFRPTCHHKPPAVLRNLIKQGLMWAEKRQALAWGARTERWGNPQPGPDHWCGLTAKGVALIDARRAWHEAEYAKKERGKPDY